jgi:proline iminopeptidase
MTALTYALRYPEATRALVIAGSAPSWRFYEDPDCIYNPLHAEAWREEEARLALDGSEEATKRWLRTVISLSVHDRTVLDDLVESSSIVPERLAAVRDEVLADPPWDLEDELASIRCPTLVLSGRYDNQCPPRWSELMHERIPDSELVRFERSGHFPFEEEPERFREVVAAFLAALAAPPPSRTTHA